MSMLGIMEVNSADGFAYEILRRCMLFASESGGTYEKQIRVCDPSHMAQC